MTHTATVTLKKGEETVKRDIQHDSAIKTGLTFVIGGEPWVVDKVHGKEPEKPDLIEQPKPQPKPEPKPVERPKAPQAKHHTPVKKSHRR